MPTALTADKSDKRLLATWQLRSSPSLVSVFIFCSTTANLMRARTKSAMSAVLFTIVLLLLLLMLLLLLLLLVAGYCFYSP